MSVEKPLIIAHRGASAFAPENTFAAFRKAVDGGADGIEFDVRFANDGVPVVFHDSTLKRLAKIERRVSDFTAAELNKIDVGSWFNERHPKNSDDKFSVETVPTLANLFDFLRDYKGLIYVELKGKDSVIPALAENVCDLIRQTDLLPNIIIKSFKLEGIKIAKRILPEVRAAALFEPKILTILRKKKLILDEAEKYNADEISIHCSLATRKFLRQARERKFPVTIWTADNPAWVKRASDFGINAIITNNPAKLLAERERIQSLFENAF
ncbi:MAG: glycerophosphodiester phosphodiesterase [Pyrinomonadaceae bacterium]